MRNLEVLIPVEGKGVWRPYWLLRFNWSFKMIDSAISRMDVRRCWLSRCSLRCSFSAVQVPLQNAFSGIDNLSRFEFIRERGLFALEERRCRSFSCSSARDF